MYIKNNGPRRVIIYLPCYLLAADSAFFFFVRFHAAPCLFRCFAIVFLSFISVLSYHIPLPRILYGEFMHCSNNDYKDIAQCLICYLYGYPHTYTKPAFFY